MPAHRWVELVPGPLVGRALSRVASKGGCRLRKSLDSLSSDGWGCAPVLSVVWPEESQQWHLQVIGWGQV